MSCIKVYHLLRTLPFPKEIIDEIAPYAAGSWKAALRIEAVRSGMPHKYECPIDMFEALDDTAIAKIFPYAHSHIERLVEPTKKTIRLDNPGEDSEMSLLELIFRLRTVGSHHLDDIVMRNMDSPKVIRFLQARDDAHLYFTEKAMVAAAYEGDLEWVKKLEAIDVDPRWHAWAAAAGCNHRNVVEFLGTTFGDVPRGQKALMLSMIFAARYGHLELVEYLNSHFDLRCKWDYAHRALDEAVKNGHLQIVKLLATEYEYSDTTIRHAASKGHLEIVKFLRNPDDNSKFSVFRDILPKAIADAGGNGHLHVVEYLLLDWDPELGLISMDRIASNGNLQILQYLQERGVGTCSEKAMEAAASHGHLNVVRFLHENGYGSTQRAMDAASAHGHLDVVEFLHFHRSEGCTTKAMDHAANGGHLAVVKFLHANREEGCSERAMNWAASEGHLEVVKFLHLNRSEGCSSKAMNNAAKGGHLAVVKFLTENRDEGCTQDAMNWAARGGHLHVVKFLHFHRTEGCSTDAMKWAAEKGHLDVVKFLHFHRQEGCTSEAMDRAAKSGYLHVVKFLDRHREEGCSTAAMDKAAEGGYLNVVQYLQENRCEGCTKVAIYKAAENGHLDVLDYLYRHRPKVYYEIEGTIDSHFGSVRKFLGSVAPHFLVEIDSSDSGSDCDDLLDNDDD
ncbi:hypothetical protein HDU97_002957 [Phlyctochytrium planicorne]|nr:hypothetical protein HDU97_002957 [Phlyctochytrium planicorne]